VPAYDGSFTPPAPVADVTVGHPVSSATSGALRGKLDTGADLTVIPESLVPQLALSARADVWARGYDGTFSKRPVYYVRLRLGGHELPAIRCIAADRRNVLVGRNVLNRFVINLDGRNLRFEVQPA
jgi:predicted aspartyl protease